jgi:hypothetical protein
VFLSASSPLYVADRYCPFQARATPASERASVALLMLAPVSAELQRRPAVWEVRFHLFSCLRQRLPLLLPSFRQRWCRCGHRRWRRWIRLSQRWSWSRRFHLSAKRLVSLSRRNFRTDTSSRCIASRLFFFRSLVDPHRPVSSHLSVPNNCNASSAKNASSISLSVFSRDRVCACARSVLPLEGLDELENMRQRKNRKTFRREERESL